MPETIKPREDDMDRFDRSRRIDWLDMDAIRGCRCLVVGAGALGNEVVKDLVLSGFRQITLVDMDHIVLSNLNRCLFFKEEDCEGKIAKAEVVASRAGALDPSVNIVPLVRRVQELDDEIWDSHHLVLGCLDNIMARLHTNAQTYYHDLPYIDGGTHGFRGRVQVVLPPTTPCFQCGLNKTHFQMLERRFSCTGSAITFFEPRLPAEITTTSLIAAVQVREALKIVCGRPEQCIRHLLLYDGERGMMETYELETDPRCPNHSRPRQAD